MQGGAVPIPYDNLRNRRLIRERIGDVLRFRENHLSEDVPDRYWIISLLMPDSVSRVLEVGPGRSFMFKHLFARGLKEHMEYHTVDTREYPDEKDITQHIFDAGADIFPLEDESFDLVIATDVIEHILNTDNFLDNVRRVMKPDGAVLLSTPNYANPKYTFRMLMGKMLHNPLGSDMDKYCFREHVKYFCTGDLLRYVRSCSLHPEALITHGLITGERVLKCSVLRRALIRRIYNHLPRLHHRFSHETILVLRKNPVGKMRRFHVS